MQKENPVYRESRFRSVMKAFSWRILATGTTFLISFQVTGKIALATSIASVEAIAKMALYYFHERAWQLLPRGTIRKLISKRVK